MGLSLTMARSMSIFGRGSLKKSLAWYAPKPNQLGKFHSDIGETASCNALVFHSLGLDSLYYPFQPF